MFSRDDRHGIELFFGERAVAPARFDRHVVQASRREAFPEMAQTRHDDPHHRHADVRSGLVEHQKLHAAGLDQRAAPVDLVAHVRRIGNRIVGPAARRRPVRRRQIGMVRQLGRLPPAERQRIVDRRAGTAPGQPGQALVQFADGAERGDARVGVRAGAVNDILGIAAGPPRYGRENRNAEILGDVEYP